MVRLEWNREMLTKWLFYQPETSKSSYSLFTNGMVRPGSGVIYSDCETLRNLNIIFKQAV